VKLCVRALGSSYLRVSLFVVQGESSRIYFHLHHWMIMSKKVSKTIVYSWAAYMWTHQPEEMKKFLKRGTPSDELIKLSETPVGMTLSDGKFKVFTFPESLNTAKGQKTLYSALVNVKKYVYAIPAQSFAHFNHIKASLCVRRADARTNILMVAEAVLHRAATEFKHEVLFAFDSINVWINAKYGKELGYLTLRKALEVLAEQGFIRVNEWGKRGNRSKCTKIQVLPQEYILTYTSNLDDWLLESDHAMNAVYRRESVTRLDVLEASFHHFIDMLEEDEAAEAKATARLKAGTRLFASTDARMVEVIEVSSEKVLENEINIDRLLGRLVPAMQETVPVTGQTSSGVLRINRSD
jgi:hypothetical protein